MAGLKGHKGKKIYFFDFQTGKENYTFLCSLR